MIALLRRLLDFSGAQRKNIILSFVFSFFELYESLWRAYNSARDTGEEEKQ